MQPGPQRTYDIISGSDAEFNQCLQQAGNERGYANVILASKTIQVLGLVNSCTMSGGSTFFMCTEMGGPDHLIYLETHLVTIIETASNLNQLRDGQVGDINLTGNGGSVLLRSRPN